MSTKQLLPPPPFASSRPPHSAPVPEQTPTTRDSPDRFHVFSNADPLVRLVVIVHKLVSSQTNTTREEIPPVNLTIMITPSNKPLHHLPSLAAAGP